MTEPLAFGKPMLGQAELEAVARVLSSGTLVHGGVTQEFEHSFAQLLGIKHAIAVSSCTAGLHLGLFAKGIGPGMRVAVPAMTHVATAHVVELVGATPVFVDVNPLTGNIDTDLLREAATDGLNAIIPVHYLGLPCDMEEIREISDEVGAFVLEDCALSLGAKYDGQSVGGLGDGGSFSFYPVKHMTSIEGGMFTTNDDDLAAMVRKCRAFGYNRDLGNRIRPGLYDVDVLGFNYRMNEVEAAVGLHQLPKLADWLVERGRNYRTISAALAEFPDIKVFPDRTRRTTSSHYCLNIVLPHEGTIVRNRLQDRLAAMGIGTSIYYPAAVPLFTYYREKYGYSVGDYPVAEWLAANTISLPVGPHLGDGGASRIAEAVSVAIREELNENSAR